MFEVLVALDPSHRGRQVEETRHYLARRLEARGADTTQIRFAVEDDPTRGYKIMRARATAPEHAYPKMLSIASIRNPTSVEGWEKPLASLAFASLIQNLDAQRHALMPAQAAKTRGLKPAQLRMVIRYLEAVLGAMKP